MGEAGTADVQYRGPPDNGSDSEEEKDPFRLDVLPVSEPEPLPPPFFWRNDPLREGLSVVSGGILHPVPVYSGVLLGDEDSGTEIL